MLGGVKHCGKTTLGSAAAEIIDASFADTDALLEKLYAESNGEKICCRDIFRTIGEESFRRLEAEAVSTFTNSARGRWIIALGGGAVANKFINWQELPVMRVMADVPEDTVRKRILASGIPPFLGNDIAEFNVAFPEWFAQRRKSCLAWAEMIFTPDPEISPAENARHLAEKLTREG